MTYSILNPPEPEPEDDSIVVAGVVVGALTATAFGIGGFYFINDQTGSMGSVLFGLLPVATRFATALVVRGRRLIFSSLFLGALLCTGILLLTGMEGWRGTDGMEQIGVETEHEYLFEEVKRKVNGAK